MSDSREPFENDELSPDEDDDRPVTSPRVKRLRLLAIVGVLVIVAIALYAASPWLLPLRIVEGPMVQQSTANSALLVWYTSRPAECVFAATGVAAADITHTSDGRRHLVRLNGLAPDAATEYHVSAPDGRALFDGQLRTNKPIGAAFSFVVFGDSGRATAEQYQLAAEMIAQRPDFVLHTGDLVYSRGARHDYEDRFFRPYRAMLSEVTFWPSLGNHDVSKPDFGAPYLEVFELPENGPTGLPAEHDYWFDYGDARVAIVDSNHSEDELRQHVAPWLEKTLGVDGPRWRFAVFHHPPYTGGKYKPDEKIISTIVPALEAAGVDIVFSGHDHMYMRMGPIRGGQLAAEGPVYIVSGAGGAKLYEARPEAERPDYVKVLRDDLHSFTHVEVDGDRLTLRQIALGGAVLDEYQMSKTPAMP